MESKLPVWTVRGLGVTQLIEYGLLCLQHPRAGHRSRYWSVTGMGVAHAEVGDVVAHGLVTAPTASTRNRMVTVG